MCLAVVGGGGEIEGARAAAEFSSPPAASRPGPVRGLATPHPPPYREAWDMCGLCVAGPAGPGARSPPCRRGRCEAQKKNTSIQKRLCDLGRTLAEGGRRPSAGNVPSRSTPKDIPGHAGGGREVPPPPTGRPAPGGVWEAEGARRPPAPPPPPSRFFLGPRAPSALHSPLSGPAHGPSHPTTLQARRSDPASRPSRGNLARARPRPPIAKRRESSDLVRTAAHHRRHARPPQRVTLPPRPLTARACGPTPPPPHPDAAPVHLTHGRRRPPPSHRPARHARR